MTPKGSRVRSEVICFESTAHAGAEAPSRHPVAALGLSSTGSSDSADDPLGIGSREGTRPNGADPAPVAQLNVLAADPPLPSVETDSARSAIHVVVVPGNPGCAAYYHDFSTQICEVRPATGP